MRSTFDTPMKEVLLKVWPAHDGVTDWARVREVIEVHERVVQTPVATGNHRGCVDREA